ncbi:hypothetical protein OSB04_022416 [Centaurea solstitialis]|uniref:Reverse transcriptase domain-containing protein n=1 Tax=Centaurea solstitialis TaxID=347529 RepID=A0AA38T3W6_9ASTR|nr:hypothetical protein OSB04_022416 [Centaurea solstitialis]
MYYHLSGYKSSCNLVSLSACLGASLGPCDQDGIANLHKWESVNQWFTSEDFQQLVAISWASGGFTGSGDTILKNKLKKLKQDIKVWEKKELEVRSKNKNTILEALKTWDEKAEKNSLAAGDVQKREELLFDLLQIEHKESLDLKQKSRIRWAVEGDENSAFFHSYVNHRWRCRNLKGLIYNGIWQETPSVVKTIAKDHFARRFTEPFPKRPGFFSNKFKQLSQEDRDFLEAPFSSDEIKEAIWDCDGSKAPGPDGFNFNFIKKFWNVLKDSILDAIKHFESTRKLARGCNASFVALIPKKVDPLLISDFRPISLLGCMYKIIAKLLANRLSRVISKLISLNQSAFIKGRQITDSVLIANEISNYAKRKGLKLMLFKVDFEKAFDSVNWDFLISIMEQMGFGCKWCDWIKGCISSASISVLINGSPSEEFLISRGLRQGDPLSPFLFLLVGEALQVMTLEACEKGLFKGVTLASSNRNVSLIQYADDALFFGHWSKRTVGNLMKILHCFYEVSGLKINLSKSRIFGVGIQQAEVSTMANVYKCQAGSLPFIYLGLPVGANMNRIATWGAVIESFNRRLNVWKARSLSIGGRTTLIKSVLTSLPLYFCSVFKAPKGVIKILESIRRRFFWGMKEDKQGIYWVAWKKILDCKDDGGLNIQSLKIKNLALLAKWHWRLINKEEALWKDVIAEFYGNDVHKRPNQMGNSVWNAISEANDSIEQLGVGLNSSFLKVITNGSSAPFWSLQVCAAGPKLKDLFPRLFAQEVNKGALFRERWIFNANSWIGNWCWRSDIRGRTSSELADLEELLRNLGVKETGEDSWIWSLDSHGMFNVNTLAKLLQKRMATPVTHDVPSFWNSCVPLKVNSFVWRMMHNALPTKANLHRRGISLPSIACDICDSAEEDLDHCLFKCVSLDALWRKVWAWCGVSGVRTNSLLSFKNSFLTPRP